MKTPRFHISIVMAAAIGTLTLIVSIAQAGPPKTSGRFRHSEQDAASLTNDSVKGTVNIPARRVSAPPGYPRYRLIDLGTLGGANSGQVFPAVSMNNRGDVIALSSTGIPDPVDPSLQDGFIWHGILSNAGGVVHDLGALPGVNQSLAGGVSRNGLIAGFSSNGLLDPLTDFPQVRAVMWDSARNIHDLGTLGGNTSQASYVNSRGQVAGFAANAVPENSDVATFFNGFLPAAQQVRAFMSENGLMRDIGTLGGNDSMAVLINEMGAVCGFSSINTEINDTTGLPTIHPFLWINGQMRDLGSLGGTLATTGSFVDGPWGRVMNDQAHVAGTSLLAGDEDRGAFIWRHGQMTDLGSLGGNATDAYAISNNDQVVGRSRTTNTPGSHHPFLWENGQMTDLGVAATCTRGTAHTINSRGEVGGGFAGCTPDPDDRAVARGFYWKKGKPIVDVNSLITPASNLWVDDISFINDAGQMAGTGVLPDGSTRAVLLVPIPGR
jgi:probable HAF family extracellular repeat protein